MMYSRLKSEVLCDSIFKCDDDEGLPFKKYAMKFKEIKDLNLETLIYNHSYYKNVFIEEINVVIRYIRRDWMILQTAIINDSPIQLGELVRIREGINRCLTLIIQNLNDCDSDDLRKRYVDLTVKEIRTLLGITLPISDLDFGAILKLSSNCNDHSPLYQYFHTYLDLQYLILILYEVCNRKDELHNQISVVIKDMINFSKKTFTQNKQTTFICNCVKNFWLFLQIIVEKLLGEGNFWPLFNKLVENCDPPVILCLLKDVGELQAYGNDGKLIENSRIRQSRLKPNYSLLESVLKELIISSEYQSSILPNLKSIRPLVCDLWLDDGRIEIFQILWDYFSKRLNASKRINSTFSTSEIIEIIKQTTNCEDAFEMFVIMLQQNLIKHPHHWSKMKGRIYSQLGPNKVKDLNEIGLFHVLLLFVALTKVNFDELAKKYLNFINNLPPERKQTSLIFNFYSAFLCCVVQEGQSIETIAPTFVNLLIDASNDKKFHLIKTFINDFEQIIQTSSNLQLHQWVLIDHWINKYLATCYHPDLVTALNILLKTVEQINKEKAWIEWEAAFKSFIYPVLKTISSSLSAPEESGTLAGVIVVNSPSLLPEAFLFFNDVIIIPKVSSSFLSVVLDSTNSIILTGAQETVAIQTWVKTCLLTTNNTEDLSKKIAKLDIVPNFVKKHLIKSKNPLGAFIDCFRSNIDDHLQSLHLNRLCETCFGNADRWIRQYFSQPENEGVVLRVFTYVALACYNIGPLLYDKHKTNCTFTKLVNAILLPNELLLGKSLHPFILSGVKKTWHMFFEATMKLNSLNDTFIDRTLRDMIVKYVPHFLIVDSPMLKCLDNDQMAEIILEKMSNSFFKKSSSEQEANISKALQIILVFVQATTSITAMNILVKKALDGLFDVIMFNANCKSLALGIIKTITNLDFYFQIRSSVEDVIIVTTEKSLAFYTNEYFHMMTVLAKVVNLRNVMPRIKQQISRVETMRGVGFDKNLRMHLEKLQAIVNN